MKQDSYVASQKEAIVRAEADEVNRKADDVKSIADDA